MPGLLSGPAAFLLLPAAALVVAIHWKLPAGGRSACLAALSFVALTAFEPVGMFTLLAFGLVFHRFAPMAAEPGRAWIRTVLVVGVLAHLAAYKYVPPLLTGRALVVGTADLVVPLGISYYTFKLIHFAVEAREGALPERTLADTLAWLFLLPTFTAGPIERLDHLLEHRERRLTGQAALEGLTRILLGVVKKFALANALWRLHAVLGGAEGIVTNLEAMPTAALWGRCALFYLFAYLDFSAYSDLAIGASRLVGFRIEENFRWPVLATDIGDFWRRWHRTLAGWCRDYVYVPLLARTRRPEVAVVAAWLAIGLWHAGSLSYVAWGLHHALGVVVWQRWRRWRRKRGRKTPGLAAKIIGGVLTFLFVTASFGWILGHGHGGVAVGGKIVLRLFGF
jgi:alginate O-acetyltransferase complex protein AlgI